MDTSLIIIIANACISGGYVLVKLGSALISFGKSLKDPNKKALKKQNKRGFLEICVSLFYKVLVQINSVFKFYHKMSNCCISILNRQCSFFCYIFNC